LKKLSRKIGPVAPCIILVTLFILTFFAEASPFTSDFTNYNPVPQRNIASYVPNSSDISVIVEILSINPSAQEIDCSLYISAWLDINLTQINVQLRSNSVFEYLNMTNDGIAAYNSTANETWGYYYQISSTISINESLSGQGFSNRFPYDYYPLAFYITFFTDGAGEPTFNQTFQPNFDCRVYTSDSNDWKTQTYSLPIQFSSYSFELDVGAIVARDTIMAALQFMIPTVAIYLLMGYYLFTGSSNKWKDRLSLSLTVGVLTLSLYTFLLSQIHYTPLFVQNLAVSLVVSNVILLVFSIISSSKSDTSSRKLELSAMVLASITPIIYIMLSGYDLAIPTFQIINATLLWKIQYILFGYIDYRYLLWLIIFQLLFWSAYLQREKALVPVTFFTGIGIVILNSLKVGILQDPTFTMIGFAMSLVAAIFAANSLLKPCRKSPEQPYESSDFGY